MTLTDLCERLRNWFDVDRHFGTFTIENGTIDLNFIREGQFYRIMGSTVNDGVCFYGGTYLKYVEKVQKNKQHGYDIIGDVLIDEEFDGVVWELAIPRNVIETYSNMCEFETKNADVLNSPFQSESFGVYSRSYRNLTVWDNFSSELARWQKI